ncbi:MAG: hypothetical protein L0206_07660 [Actinobacteria bacterium]|nr:hypothetical protein [Actinomycetota bacterium]
MARGETPSYERFAGVCAIATGVGGFSYAVAFVLILRNAPRAADTASALFLLFGGILAVVVLVALYERLRETDPSFALLGLLLGTVAAIGSTVHGGYNLATIANPPGTRLIGLPYPSDPRGLLTFGVMALSILTLSWLITRSGTLPRRLGHLGYASAALLLGIYLGRLIVLDPKSPLLLAAALLAGFVVNPAWFVWLGLELRKAPASVAD